MSLEKITARQALSIFDTIRKHGTTYQNGHRLNGIYAESDHDGYTLFISNETASLTVFFHNKLQLTYTKSLDKQQFLHALEQIYQTQYH